MRKRVIILGSTGSIGRSALDVVASLADELQVVGLGARGRWNALAEQASRFAVPHVAIADERHYDDLCRACRSGTRVLAGDDGLVELVATTDADFVLAAIVGAAGLPATLAAVERGIDVGLANKESLVIAGSIIMPLAKERSCKLIPVDSEHSAIFQALAGGEPHEVRRIYLTSSGGPFRTWSKERIERAELKEALNHPVWSMGPKITIDSATMMNKALEVIEAHHFFGIEVDRIEVLVHPESVVHSMVEFCDGSVIAQLGTPDMKTPIQYAMMHPRRVTGISKPLNWSEARSLHFEPPDLDRFPALRLGFEAARAGGSAGAVLNAANEQAVERYREGRIIFGRISAVAEEILERHRRIAEPTLEELMECDAWARREVDACI